jgi:hypothetical protein
MPLSDIVLLTDLSFHYENKTHEDARELYAKDVQSGSTLFDYKELR